MDERRPLGDLLLDLDLILCKISSDAGAVLLLLRIEYLDEELEAVALDICRKDTYTRTCVFERDGQSYTRAAEGKMDQIMDNIDAPDIP